MLFTHSEENCSNSLTFPRAVGSCWSLHMCIHMSALWTLPILFSLLSFFFCLWTVSTNFSFTAPLIALWCSQAWNTKKHQINLVLLCQLMQKHKSTNSVWFGVFYVCLALLVQSWLNCFTDRGGPSLFFAVSSPSGSPVLVVQLEGVWGDFRGNQTHSVLHNQTIPTTEDV